MRIDDIDPDERDDRRRRRWPWVVGAAAVAIGAVAAVLVARGPAAPPAAVATTTTEAPPDTVPPEPVPPFNPNAAPQGFPDFGSDYTGAELTTLYERTTDAGILVRIQDLGGWEVMAEDAAVPAIGEAGGAAVPGPERQGWVPPGWCNPAGGFRVSMGFRGSMGTSQGSWFDEPRDGVTATLFSSGFAEGTPFRVLVLQLAPDVTAVAVRFNDGAVDAAEPKQGWLALAVPGAQEGRFDLTVQDATGSRVVGWREFPQMGDLAWQKACNPPPPELPPAGEQPADAAAAEASIRERFDLLWDWTVPREDKPDDLLDDWTGVDEAVQIVQDGGFAQVARTAEHTITDFVFASPTVGWFMYDIQTASGNFTNRFGYATLVDGVWRLSRDVICQDLALAGAQCEPASVTIQPPVG